MAQSDLRQLVSELVHDAIADELRQALGGTPSPSVGEYFAVLALRREQLKLATVRDDRSRFRLHVLPVLGTMAMRDVRPRHLIALAHKLRTDGQLSHRSILRVFALLSVLFKAAVADELIASTPYVLPRGTLPPNVDRDPAWRPGAVFSVTEANALISDSRLPLHRRVLYALKFGAALRHGEAKRLCWQDIQERDPLAAILLNVTKTKRQRQVPIHPMVSWVLSDWRLRGWRETYGRGPVLSDLVVPNLALHPLDPSASQHRLLADLERLGFRRRRGHDMRRTFISLCRSAGARDEVLRAITHGPKNDILEVYTSWSWPTLCEAVMYLPLSAGTAMQPDLPFTEETHRFANAPSVGPAGYDPAADGLKAKWLSLLDDTSTSAVVRRRG